MTRRKLSPLQRFGVWLALAACLALIFGAGLQQILTAQLPRPDMPETSYPQSEEDFLHETLVSAIVGSGVAGPVSWVVVEVGSKRFEDRE